MIRQPIDSTSIKSVGFDPAQSILEVEFHNGGIYQYQGVAEAVFHEFMEASSRGAFLNEHIKPRYPFFKVQEIK